MKKPHRRLTLFSIAACILLVFALMALYVSPEWQAFLSDKLAPVYMKCCVNIPNGDDMHRFYVNDGYTSPNAYIAHGGGIRKYVLDNSLEAAQDSIRRGFRFIEFDLLVTSDGHLVGGHSWPDLRKRAHLPAVNEPMSIDEVIAHSRPGEFSPITSRDICRLLEENPDLTVVTDQIRDYELLLREIPYPDRLIVEILGGRLGACMRYGKAIKAGIKYPSMTVRNLSQMELAYNCNIPIISLGDKHLFNTQKGAELVGRIHDKGITILIFSLEGDAYWETEEFVRSHLGKTFSLYYAEKYGPNDLPPSQASQKGRE